MKRLLLLFSLFVLLCLFASCGSDEAVVSFDSHTDIQVQSQEVEIGQRASEPSVVMERDGYHFLGWFNDNKKWDFEKDTVTKDLTLVGKWESYLSYVAVSEIESASIKALFSEEHFDGIIVTGCDTIKTENVKIPESYNGKRVVGIAPYAFADNKKIKTVIIPKAIDVIGEGAFFGCVSLEGIFAEGEEAPTGWNSNIINTQVKIEFGYNK